jgi:hypothetical protein
VTIAAVLLAYTVGVATLGARMLGHRALPFLPLMRDAEAQVERLVEPHADDAATQARDPASLATALVVLAAPYVADRRALWVADQGLLYLARVTHVASGRLLGAELLPSPTRLSR